QDLTDAYLGNVPAMERVRDVLAEANQQQIMAGNVNEEHGTKAAELLDILTGNADQMAVNREQVLLEAEAQSELSKGLEYSGKRYQAQADAMGVVAGQAPVTEEAVDSLG